MALSSNPKHSPKPITYPQIDQPPNSNKKQNKAKRTLQDELPNPATSLPQTDQIQKKKVKKQKEPIESTQEETPDSTQEQPPNAAPRKRTKSPGVRIVGGRIYDSENGKTCHQCRQKTMDFVAACKGTKNEKPCPIKFCHKCLLNRYGEKAEVVDQLEDWKCPKCRGVCNCSFCMKKRGDKPTGILVHTAKASGFQSVSEMLTVNGPEKISVMQDEVSPSNKENTSPSGGKKIKRNKPKKLKHINTDDNVGEESKGIKPEKKDKKAHNSSESDPHLTLKTEGAIDEGVDGEEKKLKKRKKKSEKSANVENTGSMRENGVSTQVESNEDGVKSEGNSKESLVLTKISTSSKEDKDKINETGDTDQKKRKKFHSRKKTTLDPIKVEESGGENNLKDNPKPETDCKSKAELNADIPLPQSTIITAVADIELPAEDVGHALQFLEFCNAFKEILGLKKGEPESVLRELTSGYSLRRKQYSSVIRFHTQLLSLIQKEMGEENSSSPTSNTSSWFQTLGKCISESRCALKEFPMEYFDRGSGGYENLDYRKRLRLLNVLCDEALCTVELRDYIDEQNEKMVERGKEAKEKVLVAKDKERRLKQQMQDEIAKAILLRNGAPLSVSEHEDLVSTIRTETATAHAEKLEAMGMVPKRKQRSHVVRTEPILMHGDGLMFWRLQGCSDEPDILLQDVGRWGSDETEDKWFTYDDEQKIAVEAYISSRRRKRHCSLRLPDPCTQKEYSDKE